MPPKKAKKWSLLVILGTQMASQLAFFWHWQGVTLAYFWHWLGVTLAIFWHPLRVTLAYHAPSPLMTGNAFVFQSVATSHGSSISFLHVARMWNGMSKGLMWSTGLCTNFLRSTSREIGLTFSLSSFTQLINKVFGEFLDELISETWLFFRWLFQILICRLVKLLWYNLIYLRIFILILIIYKLVNCFKSKSVVYNTKTLYILQRN